MINLSEDYSSYPVKIYTEEELYDYPEAKNDICCPSCGKEPNNMGDPGNSEFLGCTVSKHVERYADGNWKEWVELYKCDDCDTKFIIFQSS